MILMYCMTYYISAIIFLRNSYFICIVCVAGEAEIAVASPKGENATEAELMLQC